MMGGLRQSTDNGERVWRIDDRFTIGRDPHNDLVLSDHVVSSRHATIEDRSGEFVLVDHDSRNGTYVQRGGGEPIRVRSSYALSSGDAIRVGSSRLIFDKSISAPAPVLSNPPSPPEVSVAPPTSAFPPTERGRVMPVFLGGRPSAPAEDSVLARLEALEERVARLEADLARREQLDR